MEDRVFRDNPVAQDYLFYIQEMLAQGTPRESIETPSSYYLRYLGKDPKEGKLAALESTDSRYKAMEKIYKLLDKMP